MGKMKFESDWNFDTFLYKNYGSSYTKEQRLTALVEFTNLKNN